MVAYDNSTNMSTSSPSSLLTHNTPVAKQRGMKLTDGFISPHRGVSNYEHKLYDMFLYTTHIVYSMTVHTSIPLAMSSWA